MWLIVKIAIPVILFILVFYFYENYDSYKYILRITISKISRIRGIRIFEVGISYYGRTYEEGKKINWKDGFRALYCIFKYNILN